MTVRAKIERWFYGHHSRDERKRHFQHLVVACCIALFFCVLFGVLLYLLNNQGRI